MSIFHQPEVVCRGSGTQLKVGENLNNMNNFQALVVVDRDSETQLQVVVKFNQIPWK